MHRELCNLEGSRIKDLILATIGVMAFFFIGKGTGIDFFNEKMQRVNLGIIFLSFAAVLFMLGVNKNVVVRRLTYLGLMFVLLFELALNYMVVYDQSSYLAMGKKEYQEKSSLTLERLSRIETSSKDRYRIESFSPMTPNSSLHFGYCGVT